jgi:hypothetical protein
MNITELITEQCHFWPFDNENLKIKTEDYRIESSGYNRACKLEAFPKCCFENSHFNKYNCDTFTGFMVIGLSLNPENYDLSFKTGFLKNLCTDNNFVALAYENLDKCDFTVVCRVENNSYEMYSLISDFFTESYFFEVESRYSKNKVYTLPYDATVYTNNEAKTITLNEIKNYEVFPF